MPDPQNTVQVAPERAGQSYLDTYELEPDAIPPGMSFAASAERPPRGFFETEGTGTRRMSGPFPVCYPQLWERELAGSNPVAPRARPLDLNEFSRRQLG
jgi:hypothetical protein